MGQPDFGLSRDFLIKENDTKLVDAYFNYMVNIAVELGCDKTKAESELKKSLELEVQMAKVGIHYIKLKVFYVVHSYHNCVTEKYF